ncbi:unnamed protein product [Pedinophyceae sp. YPF-701]|nr:unnamed protein product [Pedinophyceae sp. YPF-701]
MTTDKTAEHERMLAAMEEEEGDGLPELPRIHSSALSFRGPKLMGPRSGTRSQFGLQSESHKRSSPQVGFGSAPRFDSKQKRFISKGHSHALLPVWTPGPGTYKREGALGKQAYSERISKGEFSFCSDNRFGPSVRERQVAGKVPGPGAYPHPTSLGDQTLSVKASAGRVGFPTSQRSNQVCYKGQEEQFYARGTPGPGTYVPDRALGEQTLAGRTSAATVSFSREERAMNKGGSRAKAKAMDVPGPGDYFKLEPIGTNKPAFSFSKAARGSRPGSLAAAKAEMEAGQGATKLKVPESLGSQLRSDKRTYPQFRFSQQQRFKAAGTTDETTPGPGSYWV